jgi:tetrahydromethanopterin S-methyltransferase subunit F
MATVTDADLKELKDLLIEVKVSQARMEAQLAGIDKRLDVIKTRVGGLTNWIVGILFALVGGKCELMGKAIRKENDPVNGDRRQSVTLKVERESR